jgi:YD repeat-containing protein
LTLTTSCDANGNPTLVTDSLGGTTSVYDPLNRLSSRQYTDSSGDILRYDQAYDGQGNMRLAIRHADLAGTQVIGASKYLYDNAGRVLSVTDLGPSGARIAYFAYGYDKGGRLTSEADNNQPGVSFGYDTANELTFDGSAAGSGNYSYDPAGNKSPPPAPQNRSVISTRIAVR